VQVMKSTSRVMMASTHILSICPLLLMMAFWTHTAHGFDCYTGDGRVLRRKTCPTLGSLSFTDLCFKTVDTGTEVQRGCFNRKLTQIIMNRNEKDLEMGCHKVPKDYGEGELCVCDTELCNSAPSLMSSFICPTFFGTSCSATAIALATTFLTTTAQVLFQQRLFSNM